MLINSLYKFYKLYFGYEGSTNKKRGLQYVFAIHDTLSVLENAYLHKDENVIEDYFNAEKKSAIAVKLLKNTQSLYNARTENPLEDLQFFNCNIKVSDKYLIKGTRNGIRIPFQYIWDKKNNDVIILTFGVCNNFIGEIEVLLGLIYGFNIDKPLDKKAKLITYWNLSNATENSIEINKVVPASKENIIRVINNHIKNNSALRKQLKN